jgi:hypothetical protein
MVSADRPCEAATPDANSAHSARPRRLRVSTVESCRACQGGTNSGRAVATASSRADPMLSIT